MEFEGGFQAFVRDTDIMTLDWISDTLEMYMNAAAHHNKMIRADLFHELASAVVLLRTNLKQQDRRTGEFADIPSEPECQGGCAL